MDVSVRKTLPRRAARGALVGCGLGLLLTAILVLADGLPSGLSWPEALPLIVGAAVIVCTAGEILAHSPFGACAGLAAGAILGSTLNDTLRRPPPTRNLGETAQIAGVTLSGKKLDINDYRGQVVLVDFWATWCPPCREELPRIRALHKRHHGDGLRIVGVSLDEKRKPLEDFVQDKRLDWPQLFSDQPGQQGWDNPIARSYKVRAIPQTLLIDRNGTIVAAGLLGSELEEAVEKLLAGGEQAGAAIQADVQSSGFGRREPLVPFFAVVGWLLGMLTERRLRQVV